MKLSEAEIKSIPEMYASGLTTTQIAVALGCASENIRYHLKRAGVSRRVVGAKGRSNRRFLHGWSKTAEHRIWMSMRTRCNNPHFIDYKNYGGRGIRVCERWQKFENFVADMGQRPSDKHSLDRIDNDGHYEPGNCRWATKSEQASNTRFNRILTVGGVSKTATQWEKDLGFKQSTISSMIRKRGWTDEKAVMTPPRWAMKRRKAK